MNHVPFLHPALLGIALAVVLIVGALAPVAWRRWWILSLAGAAVASLFALCGVIPWTGNLIISAYGFFLLLALVLAYVLILSRAKEVGLDERHVIDIALLALSAGLVGGRLFEIIDHWSEFSYAGGRFIGWDKFLAKAADFDSGGLVWYGGALLGAATILVWAWRKRIGLLMLADLCLPSVVLALGIGRIGCFFNGCCFGQITDVGWAVSAFPGPHYRHPAQLYETVVCSLLFAGCWLLWRHRRWDGQVTLVACLGYALWRFLNEFLRQDKVMTTFWGMFPASTAQVISIHLALAAIVVALVVQRRRRNDPELARQSRLVPGSVHAPEKLNVAVR